MADTKTLVSAQEQHKIDRAVLVWLNTYPELSNVLANAKLGNDAIRYEELPADSVGMAVSVVQGAYITRKYIYGGYLAEYQFQLVYRLMPTSIDGRLKAVEVLDAIGDWASEKGSTIDGMAIRFTSDHPIEIEGVTVTKVEAMTRAALVAKYENGTEDYQILLKLTYEVN